MNRISNGSMRVMTTAFLVLMPLATGCFTMLPPEPAPGYDVPPATEILLEAGDQLEFSFLGTPELNCMQRIRRDGRISLPIIGDVIARGTSVEDLKAKLKELYAPHLQSREITIIVRSQPPVFVSGAVRSPGRIEMLRNMTALEAVMEAGGFDMDTADMKRVVVIRHTDTGRREYLLDLASVLAGKGGRSFYIQANDIVHVPKRTPWF